MAGLATTRGGAAGAGGGGAGLVLGAGGPGGAAATDGAARTGASGAATAVVIVGACTWAGLTATSGGGTKLGGGGAVLAGCGGCGCGEGVGRGVACGGCGGGGGGTGLVSRRRATWTGFLTTSTTRCARPLSSAHPSNRCRTRTRTMPATRLPGVRWVWPKSTSVFQVTLPVQCLQTTTWRGSPASSGDSAAYSSNKTGWPICVTSPFRQVVPVKRVELPTFALRMRCSTN